MLRVLGTIGVALLMAGPAAAASLVPDFNGNPAHATQLRDGDFDGDGRLDDVYLVAEDTGRIAVHIRLADRRDMRVTSIDVPANTSPNLQVVASGTFHSDCGSFADDCAGALVTQADSLILGLSSDAKVLIHWVDGRFEQDFVRSDEAMVARDLAGLLALNP